MPKDSSKTQHRNGIRWTTVLSSLLLLQFLTGSMQPSFAKEPKIVAPLDLPGTTPLPEKKDEASMGGLSAPGADAVMTPDMLLVSPKSKDEQPVPLKAYVGSTLKMDIDRSNVQIGRLSGVVITVTNETNRSLVVNGEKAVALLDGKSISVAPVSTVQLVVVPRKKGAKGVEDVTLAAVTIGVAPTIRDYVQNAKPVIERYGPDELRRRVEASRFGRRIIWPNEKSTGVLYFDTPDDITAASVQIPVSTLFDKPDAGVLEASPKTSQNPAPSQNLPRIQPEPQ